MANCFATWRLLSNTLLTFRSSTPLLSHRIGDKGIFTFLILRYYRLQLKLIKIRVIHGIRNPCNLKSCDRLGNVFENVDQIDIVQIWLSVIYGRKVSHHLRSVLTCLSCQIIFYKHHGFCRIASRHSGLPGWFSVVTDENRRFPIYSLEWSLNTSLALLN